MPIQLMNLRGVLDDEADDIRQLLKDHGIDYYETPAGNWGISLPAIWLHDEHQLEQAKLLIDKYQQDRLIRVRGEYEQLKIQGRHRTLFDGFKEHPIRFIVYLAIVAAVIYFSTKPFIDIVY